MRVTVVAVGQRQPGWACEAVEDYLGRFPKGWAVEVREVRAETRGPAVTPARCMQLEAQRIRKALPEGALVIALDERGKDVLTADFARMLGRLKDEGRDAAFIIGGPDGLDPALKKECAGMIRISSMTLPHAMARVLLVEQVYRAWSILSNHPYHRV
ncbi:MAG: 23S rRNA (pseudouridine(1915)-N(3))-methyltransferase RlmH [Duodenibacillus sp.]|nr:23S rRNA (pseudouridine(1915)-N(3))-methyltransferase RlmH [Duodenibacillus sp.]